MPLKKIITFIVSILPLFVSGSTIHADSSVLATGSWYKLVVTRSGIHKITSSDLNAMGIDLSTLDVDKIRLFGNGSGMLPEANTVYRIDDLREIAIQVEDGGDGHIDANDYILFYGECADKWAYDQVTRLYAHQRNLYSDSTFYFLNLAQVAGKRVQSMPIIPSNPNTYSSAFDDYLLHELDQQNLIRSGREWYGETFDKQKSEYAIPFLFSEH